MLNSLGDHFHLRGQGRQGRDNIQYTQDIGIVVVGLIILYRIQAPLYLCQRVWVLRLTQRCTGWREN
jgi:hypothetical protein